MIERLHKVLKIAAVLLALGGAYAIFVLSTGLYIPCLFNAITCLDCPGCGVTRMCLSMIKLDFASAFHYNAALFMSLPFMAVLFMQMAVKYIKTGNNRFNAAQKFFVWLLVLYFVVWTIVRNLY